MVAAPSAPPFARKVLVLYAPADEAFARGYLAAALGLPVEDGDEDHPIGLALSSRELAARPVSELGRLVTSSQLVLPILSPAFLADPWLQLSDEMASHRAATDGDELRGVIPLLLEECELPLHLRTKVFLDFRRAPAWQGETKRLSEALERPPEPPPEVPCPYPGMRPFRDSDAAFFHGRDEEIAEILRRLAAGERELMVIGPSGSGKSSLIAAGVVPSLRGEKIVRSFRPGAAPLGALTAALGATPGSHPGDAVAALCLGRPESGLLLVVDQAEELFSLASLDERKRFAAALRALRQEPRCALVLTLRADFFAELLGSELWSEGAKQHLDLAPMRGAALRRAIEEPARQHDVFLESRLVDQLLADADDEPGALPLLQEALVQLWSARRHRLLTLDEYRERGGLSAALIQRADHTLAALSDEQQQLARRVFLRLVAFGEGRPHTRRRQAREALRGTEPPAALDAVLMALSQARLITMDGTDTAGEPSAVHVDLCHDVLITAWPSFASWVEARRSAEQQRRRWREHAHNWISRGRGSSAHLDADELAAARAWAASADAVSVGVDPDIAALLTASERILRHQQLRRRRGLIAIIAGLATFTAVALLLATCASLQREQAVTARGETSAQLARNRALLAEQYQDAARRFLVDGHPQRALPYLLAAREQSSEPPGPILRALFRAASRTRVRFALRTGGELLHLSYSGDGQRLITASSDGTAQRWRASDGAPLGEPMRHAEAVVYAELSPDGARALTRTADGAVHLWTPAHLPLAITAATSAHLSSDGARVITTSEQQAQLWDARTGAALGPPLLHDQPLRGARLSPDGKRLAVLAYNSSKVMLWTLGTAPDAPTAQRLDSFDPDVRIIDAQFDPRSDRLLLTLPGLRSRSFFWASPDGAERPQPSCPVSSERSAAFFFTGGLALTCATTVEVFPDGGEPYSIPFAAPVERGLLGGDGRSLAVMTSDSMAHVWDLQTRRLRAQFESPFGSTLAASPDGDHFAVGELRGTARVWQLPPAAPPSTLELGTKLSDLEASAGGGWLALANVEGVLLTRTSFTEPPTLIRLPDVTPWRIAVSPDDRWIAVQSWHRSTSLCEIATRRCRALHAPLGRALEIDAEAVIPLDFSPDGALLAAPISDVEVQLWEVRSGERFGAPLRHAEVSARRSQLASLRFSPDGKRLVSASSDGTARVFAVATGAPLGEVIAHEPPSPLTSAFFSGDGAHLITTAGDGTIEVRDAATLQRERRLRQDARVLAAKLSGDGHTLATFGADFRAVLWDLRSGAQLHVLEHSGWVTNLAFSPDGSRLATVGEELRLWSVATGQPLTPPLFHERPATKAFFPTDALTAYQREQDRSQEERVYDLAFAPDGAWLYTISYDGSLRRWDTSLDDASLEEWRALVERSPFSRAAP